MGDLGLIGERIGVAFEEARQEAEASLQNALHIQFDNVPCVACGRYQPEMVERMAAKRYRLLHVGMVFAMIPSAILPACTVGGTFATWQQSAYTALNLSLLALGWVLSAATIWFAWWMYQRHKRLVTQYEPHGGEDPRQWIAMARRRGAVTAEEFMAGELAKQEAKPWDPGPSESASTLSLPLPPTLEHPPAP